MSLSVCHKCFNEYEGSGACPKCGYDAAADAGKYPHALKAGSILGGRYIAGKVLGQGGFGITYIAQDYDTKQLVAIKEFMPEMYATRIEHGRVSVFSAQHESDFAQGKENFLNEAKTLSQFNGLENICDIYSYFEENGTAYFAMEYVQGTGLDTLLKKRGLLSVEQARELLLPLMRALSHVHEKGIIHRDISPDNIIVKPDGSAMLIDFGAARYSLGEKSRSLDVVLKHGFAPKEQYTRRGRQGPFTDVYAMAATFYYSITGKLPPEAIDRMEEDELVLPSALGVQIDRQTEEALTKALSVLAQNRYQSMGEFADALVAAQSRQAEAELREQKRREQKLRQEEEKRQAKAKREAERLAAEEKKKAEARAKTELKEKKKTQRAEEKKTKAEKAPVGVKPKKRRLWLAIPALLLAAVVVGAVLFLISPTGKLCVGWMYETGIAVQQDSGKAFEYYELAAEKGNAMALNNIGVMYDAGQFVEQDMGKAFGYYLKAAREGSGLAIRNLALYYHYGNIMERDYEKATALYELAAEYGCTRANYDLGQMYFDGDGVNMNRAKALKLMEEAASRGNLPAMEYTGWIYMGGQGPAADSAKAAEWLKKAARFGSSYAMENLAEVLEEQGDTAGADKWREKAKSADDSLAYSLGIAYETVMEVVAGFKADKHEPENLQSVLCDAAVDLALSHELHKDYERASEIYLDEIEAGNVYAMYRYGKMFEVGKGVEIDYAEAASWYKKAADGGCPAAMRDLGLFFYKGRGCELDFTAAMEMFRKAAEYDDAEAVTYLGLMYMRGQGVEVDYERAKTYLSRGISLGDSYAVIYMRRLLTLME